MNTSCCRICLETKNSDQVTSIFEYNDNDAEPSIPEIVLRLCGIEISESDDFPTDICNSCLEDVTIIRKFRNQCITSDNYFKIWMGSPEILYTESNVDLEDSDYKEPENKKRRIRRQRISTKRKFPCSTCGKLCNTSKQLYSHERTHKNKSNKKEFTCDHCGKEFALKNYIYTHMLNMHIQDKRFKCDQCPAAYSKIDSFQYHMKVHLGVLDYICGICGKGFSSKGKLTVRSIGV